MSTLARRADTARAHLRAGAIDTAEQELSAVLVGALVHVARQTLRPRYAGAPCSAALGWRPPHLAILLELDRREPRFAVSASCDIDRLSAWLVDHLVTLFSLAWALSRRTA